LPDDGIDRSGWVFLCQMTDDGEWDKVWKTPNGDD